MCQLFFFNNHTYMPKCRWWLARFNELRWIAPITCSSSRLVEINEASIDSRVASSYAARKYANPFSNL